MTSYVPRDYDAKPYSEDEQRVSAYLQELLQGQVGSGDDPVGFLIASHRQLVGRLQAQPATAEFMGPPATAAKVHALCQRIWDVTHKPVSAEEMLPDLLLLAGVATARLMEYARLLPGGAASNDR